MAVIQSYWYCLLYLGQKFHQLYISDYHRNSREFDKHSAYMACIKHKKLYSRVT